jgi:hypothetical protein
LALARPRHYDGLRDTGTVGGWLFSIADLSHGDIAVAMGTTVDAARRSVYEGLQ